MRRLPSVVGALLGALLLTGCVGLPESGPVVTTQETAEVIDRPDTNYEARPPQPGESAADIVTHFLEAMTAVPLQTNVARQFLSKRAQESWNPQRAVVTYDGTSRPRGLRTIRVTLFDAQELDSRGTWLGRLSSGDARLSFPMTWEDGEWRIDRAPDALIVPQTWFESTFTQRMLYFFDPTARFLVPEPVYVPDGEQHVTALVRSLLRGPADGLDQVERSFLPVRAAEQTQVLVDDDGVATVSLPESAELPPDTARLAAVQLARTLRQVPGITSLRIEIGGRAVTGTTEEPVDLGAEYDDAGLLRATTRLFALREGRLVTGTFDRLDAASGPFGERATGIRSVGVSLPGTQAAVVTDDGTTVRVGPVSGADGQVREVLEDGSDLLRPAWDFSERLWVVNRPNGRALLTLIAGSRIREVRAPGITGRRVTRFLISRDGSRLVAVVRGRRGDALVVSRVLHDDRGRVLRATRARRLTWPGYRRATVRDIAWRSSVSVAVLTPFGQNLSQARVVGVDGSPLESASSFTLQGRYRWLASSPLAGDALLAFSRNGGVDLSRVGNREVRPVTARPDTVTYVG